MGLIKDGTISGSLPESRVFAVNYPGYPSTSRAIETLGGLEGISKARCLKIENYLELRFRPEDPYSHPAYGACHSSSNFLLKITRRKNNVSELVSSSTVEDGTNSRNEYQGVEKKESGQPLEQASQLSADIIARVFDTYEFDGMVDYQYVLPVHAEAARRKNIHRVQENERVGRMNIDNDDLMILIPPFFSRKDTPEGLVLKSLPAGHSKRKQLEAMQQQWEMNIGPPFGLRFDIDDVPNKMNWEDNIPQNSPDWTPQKAVSKLFDERPIWSKYILNERLVEDGVQVNKDMLQRILLRGAYKFATGPFRVCWIRNGYDPRRDAESRIYQRVEFRVPKPFRNCIDTSINQEMGSTWKDLCQFQALPLKMFTFFQLVELEDPYIQQEIRKPSEQTVCQQSTGWFSRNTFERLRLRVQVRFLSLLSSKEAKDLVKSNLRTIEVLESRTIDDGEDLLESNTGHNDDHFGVTEDMSRDIEHVYGNDENEDDDEIEDEDLEEYVPSDAEENTHAHPTENSVGGDNIEKGFLQQLLGRFPFTACTDNDQDFVLSEDEYQIYEPESDDNYGDTDDE
ncbi:general transcription factor 3C polypeptide 5 [Amborella trichopoda]|uniref:general transcription factor 3C polypeptide 5 n=1 Tax=Amborella trichopoda TaxID=13333 RepID=UPI0009C13D4C|nr:general transcription factor 3C polypeptide 5 [Amborella trichopoda]|eukprot:XP_020523536.1 general transcription factor 3C polypeptide 5 [Amborella trichopoda]